MQSLEEHGARGAGSIDRNETVLILDFGSQYTQLIARRVRECNVYSEIVPHFISSEEIEKRSPKGIILSGGPSSVYAEGAPDCDIRLFELGVPVLGICYGMQYMALALEGKVDRGRVSEYGKTTAVIDDTSDLFESLELGDRGTGKRSLTVWMSHGDLVEIPPPGFEIIAHTASSPVAAMRDRDRNFYGVQFHPEVVHTDGGTRIIRNFVREICGCSGSWTMESFLKAAVEQIRSKVGKRRAVCALSGGIDSSVASALVHRAIGDQLICVFVDHGFMRQGEPEQVDATFRPMFDGNLIHVHAAERFLEKLEGVSDPERKRKIIGENFIRVFEEEASKLGDIDFLVQGTTYPDVIESGAGVAETIKSHHNVGGLPDYMQLELLEPLKYLFKDEVRILAAELGLPDEIIWRQPFPGPGLAIRIMGDVTGEKLRIVRSADNIVVEEIRKAGLYKDVWQSFAVLSNTRTVGVMGDKRTYSYLVGVRAVTSQDGMTADWARLPYELLERMATRMLNEVDGINRVVYDISSKPPSTIEWE